MLRKYLLTRNRTAVRLFCLRSGTVSLPIRADPVGLFVCGSLFVLLCVCLSVSGCLCLSVRVGLFMRSVVRVGLYSICNCLLRFGLSFCLCSCSVCVRFLLLCLALARLARVCFGCFLVALSVVCVGSCSVCCWSVSLLAFVWSVVRVGLPCVFRYMEGREAAAGREALRRLRFVLFLLFAFVASFLLERQKTQRRKFFLFLNPAIFKAFRLI